MKDSGVEWIGKIPKSWEMYPIKGILNERKENNDPIKTKEILSLTIEQGVIPHSEKIGVGGNKPKEDLTKYRLAYPGDIVVNSMNILAGAVGLSQYFGAVSPVYYTLYPSSEEFSREFVTHVFKSKEFQDNLLGLGNGIMMKKSESSGKLNTIRMRIPMSKLNTQYLPMPPIEVQKKITNHLKIIEDRIDSLISKTRNTIEDYKLLKQSIITEAVTKGLDKNVEMKDSGVDWIGGMPNHWQLSKLKYEFRIKKEIAGTEGYDVLSVTQNGLKVKDITMNEGQMAADYSKYQFVKVGDYVMNHMDLLTGWVDYSTFNGVTSPDYRVFYMTNSEKNSPEYYKYIFQSCYKNKVFYGLAQGVSNLGRWRLQADKFLNFYIPIPPKEEQDKITDYIISEQKRYDEIISKKEMLLLELEQYKKSLIYEYVTGKKQVE